MRSTPSMQWTPLRIILATAAVATAVFLGVFTYHFITTMDAIFSYPPADRQTSSPEELSNEPAVPLESLQTALDEALMEASNGPWVVIPGQVSAARARRFGQFTLTVVAYQYNQGLYYAGTVVATADRLFLLTSVLVASHWPERAMLDHSIYYLVDEAGNRYPQSYRGYDALVATGEFLLAHSIFEPDARERAYAWFEIPRPGRYTLVFDDGTQEPVRIPVTT